MSWFELVTVVEQELIDQPVKRFLALEAMLDTRTHALHYAADAILGVAHEANYERGCLRSSHGRIRNGGVSK